VKCVAGQQIACSASRRIIVARRVVEPPTREGAGSKAETLEACEDGLEHRDEVVYALGRPSAVGERFSWWVDDVVQVVQRPD
jgi:outer membrane protein assembly factor BamE (lipoprotein component of BamABCDE complex)